MKSGWIAYSIARLKLFNSYQKSVMPSVIFFKKQLKVLQKILIIMYSI